MTDVLSGQELLSGRVKKTPPTDVSLDRYTWIKLQETEPDLGVPAENDSILVSSTTGTREWLAPTAGLAVNESGEIFVNENTVPVDTTGFTYSSSSVLSDVLKDLDSNISAEIVEADQDLQTTDNVTFNDVTVDGTLSAGDFVLSSGTIDNTVIGGTTPSNATFTYIELVGTPENTSSIFTSDYSVTGTDSTPAFSLGGTWNTSGSPTAILVDVTDSNSAGDSKLLDLSVDNASRFSVDKTGSVVGFDMTLSGDLKGPSAFTIDPATHGDDTGTVVIAGDLQVNGSVDFSIGSNTDLLANDVEVTGVLYGPETFTIDPATHDDNTGTVVIAGNLQVDGTTTTINSTVLTVDDKNIVLASGAGTNSEADGAGITVDGSDAAITYNGTDDRWVFNTPPYFNASRVITTADEGSGNGFDADLLDGNQGSFYLDYTNFTNTPTIGDATITLSAGGGLSSGGSFTTNQTGDATIAIDHADTSNQPSVNNSNGTVIQDVSLDDYGHVTSIGSFDLDDRYYTETEADTRFVNVSGDTMTGFLTLHANPENDLHPATKRYVDEIAQELKVLPAATVATTADLDAVYSNAGSGTLTSNANVAFPTTDGYAPQTGDNVLVKDQTNLYENGSYILIQQGDTGSSTPWVLERCSFCDETVEIPGSFEFVENGDTQAATGWVATTPSDFAIGDTAASADSDFVTKGDIRWVQFAGAGTYSAGTGLSLDGTVFNHSNSIPASTVNEGGSSRTLGYSDSFTVPSFSFDSEGHVSAVDASTEITIPSDPRNLFLGGTGVEFDSGTGEISIGQAVETTSDVTFRDVTATGDVSIAGSLKSQEEYNRIAQGFIQREGTRGDLDVDLAVAIELNLLGAPVAGGYYAGLIDTTGDGSIQSNDDYQSGQRYALIVSDKSLEGGRGASPASGLPTGDLEWDTQDRGGEAGCFTRWNGLDATNVIIAKNDTSYEVHDFVEAVRSQYPAATTPGGSEWYLPAMDELELLYRNFKPNNANNRVETRNRVFPGTQAVGTNPSSAIEGFQYENNPRIPDVTYLDLFKENAAQSIDQLFYWSTTDADEGDRAWVQYFTPSGDEGVQIAFRKDNTNPSVRPVRRVVLDDSNDTKNRSGNYNINGSITAHGLNTDGGDVSFTEDTGTTPKFVWDASAEQLDVDGVLNVDSGTLFVDSANNRVGVGTSSPSADLSFGRASKLNFYNENGDTSSIDVVDGGNFLRAKIEFDSGPSNQDTDINFYTETGSESADALALKIGKNRDISFYENTGTTPKFYWDASAERLGIGTDSPNEALDIIGNIQTSGTIYGPSVFTIDPATHGDDTGTLVVAGNLQVDGTTTTINSTTLTVEDKNIVVAQGAADPAAADGAGIVVDGANATILYDAPSDQFQFNKGIEAPSITSAGNEQTIDIITFTASDTNENTIASFDSSVYRSVKTVVQVYDTVTGDVHVTELLIMHNGVNSFATEYSTMHTSADPLTVFDVELDSANNALKLLAQNASSNQTQFKISATQIGV